MTTKSQSNPQPDPPVRRCKSKEKPNSIRSIIKNLPVGESYPFHSSKGSVVRVTSSTLGAELRRQYSTTLLRNMQTIVVKRLS